MPAGFFPLTVSKINRETPEAVSVTFDVPNHLKSMFKYDAGQYLTFSIQLNGEEVRRSYSICTPSIEGAPLSIAVKEVEGGKMSTYLNRELKEGSVIEVMPPMGKFTVPAGDGSNRNFMLFGGGSGITPMKSIIETLKEKEPGSRVVLVYANRDRESVIFKSELDAIAESHPSFEIIYSYDNPPQDWNGLSGYLNESVVGQVAKNQFGVDYATAEYFICGPSPMMDVVKRGLAEAGVRDEKIHTEYFTAVTSDSKEKKEVDADDLPVVTQDVQVEVYGETQTITVEPDQTILEAAIEADLDPPYSCTVGVCTTCRAKVKSGKVRMDEREGLSDAEIEEGYVLTCQSHPLTDDVDLVYE